MTYNITDKNSDILDLLLEAKEQGVSIFLEDGRVRLKVKEGVELTETFLKQLKEEKRGETKGFLPGVFRSPVWFFGSRSMSGVLWSLLF